MKPEQQISIDEARKFLTLLAPDEKFTFQTFDDNQDRKDPGLNSVRHGTLDQNFDHLVQYSEKGAGVFVVINKTDLRGRTKNNVEKVRSCFCDLDGVPIEPVLNHQLEPSILVESS